MGNNKIRFIENKKVLIIGLIIFIGVLIFFVAIGNDGKYTSLGKFKIPTKYYKSLPELGYDQMRVCKISENKCVILNKLKRFDN